MHVYDRHSELPFYLQILILLKNAAFVGSFYSDIVKRKLIMPQDITTTNVL